MLTALALGFALVAYWKDPGLPWIGAKTGLSLIWFILPRLIPALILTGMLQVVIPQEAVARYFGHGSGLSAILMASVAGVLTPGGPMVSLGADSGHAHGCSMASYLSYPWKHG